MAAVSRNAPVHRKIGAEAGFDVPVRYVKAKCGSCNTPHTEPVDACADVRDALRGVSCLFCGASMMRMVRS